MMESWKPIPEFDGYEVSNLGRVKSLVRSVNNNGGFRPVGGHVLSQWQTKSTGYSQVDLSGQRVSVHRVVALAWCSGFFDGAHVDHINGDRSDNRACNLEWVTPSENQKRSYRNGRKSTCKGRYSNAHPTSKAVVSTCLETGISRYWPSAMDAVRAGFLSDCISRCCNGKSGSHKGHHWRFAETYQEAS